MKKLNRHKKIFSTKTKNIPLEKLVKLLNLPREKETKHPELSQDEIYFHLGNVGFSPDSIDLDPTFSSDYNMNRIVRWDLNLHITRKDEKFANILAEMLLNGLHLKEDIKILKKACQQFLDKHK